MDNPFVGEVVHVVGPPGKVVNARRRRYAACRPCRSGRAPDDEQPGVELEEADTHHPSVPLASRVLACTKDMWELAGHLHFADNGGVGISGIARVLQKMNRLSEVPLRPRPGCDLNGHTKAFGTGVLEQQYRSMALQRLVYPGVFACPVCSRRGCKVVHVDTCMKLQLYEGTDGMEVGYVGDLVMPSPAVARQLEAEAAPLMAQASNRHVRTCGDGPDAKAWAAHHHPRAASTKSLSVVGLTAGPCEHEHVLYALPACKPESFVHNAAVEHVVLKSAVAALSSDIQCLLIPLLKRHKDAFAPLLRKLLRGVPLTQIARGDWEPDKDHTPEDAIRIVAGLHGELHDLKCQIENGGWRVRDLGRQLGEQCEQLFSRFFQLGRIVKVSSEAHFHDVVSIAILRHNMDKSAGLPASLVRQATYVARRIPVLRALFRKELQVARVAGVAGLPVGDQDVPPDHPAIVSLQRVLLDKYKGTGMRFGTGARLVSVGTDERPAALRAEELKLMQKLLNLIAAFNRAGIFATPGHIKEQPDKTLKLVTVIPDQDVLVVKLLEAKEKAAWLADSRLKGLVPGHVKALGFTTAIKYIEVEINKLLALVTSRATARGVSFDNVGGPAGYVTQAAMDALAKEQVDVIVSVASRKGSWIARRDDALAAPQRKDISKRLARLDKDMRDAQTALGKLQGLSSEAQATAQSFAALDPAAVRGIGDLPATGLIGTDSAATSLVMAAGKLLNEISEGHCLRQGLAAIVEGQRERVEACTAAAAAAVGTGTVSWPGLPASYESVDLRAIVGDGPLPATAADLLSAIDRLEKEEGGVLKAEQLLQIGYRHAPRTDLAATQAMSLGYASQFNLEAMRTAAANVHATEQMLIVGVTSEQRAMFERVAVNDMRKGRAVLVDQLKTDADVAAERSGARARAAQVVGLPDGHDKEDEEGEEEEGEEEEGEEGEEEGDDGEDEDGLDDDGTASVSTADSERSGHSAPAADMASPAAALQALVDAMDVDTS